MNKYLFLFLSISLPSCAWFMAPSKTVIGSGVSEKRPLMYMWKDKKPFDSLTISGQGTVYFTQGEGESIVIEADDNIHEYIQVEMKGAMLKINTKKGIQLQPKTPLNYYISFKEIKDITLRGAVQLKAPMMQGKKIELNLEGSSRVDATIMAEKLEVKIQGASKVNLEGKVDTQELEVKGSAQYYAGKLKSKKADIEVTGSSHVMVAVQKKLDVDAQGVAVVHYTGNPTLEIKKAGAVTIQKVG